VEYRRLGSAGLKVSVLSYGTWLTFAEQADVVDACQMLMTAREHGVNLFDTADVYGAGHAEIVLGMALEKLSWDRATYVLSTKIFCGTRNSINMHRTLNRKYLMLAIDESLERLRTPFVDLIFCHCPDPHTPLEETVWAMSDIIASGKAHYWGTSGWPVERISEAIAIADHLHLRKPVMEQPEYNLIRRNKVEKEYAPLCRSAGLGLTTWSPLASGLLTGKYVSGAPIESRAALPDMHWLRNQLLDEHHNMQTTQLSIIAERIGVSAAQLAIAWCATNPLVSSVILGARTPAQLNENLLSLQVMKHISSEVENQLDRIFVGQHVLEY